MIGGIRIRPEGRYHFTASYGMQTPLSAGRGLVSFGMGGRISDEGARLWLGLGGVPANGLGIAEELAYLLFLNQVALVARGHVMVAGDPAAGIAVGTRTCF